MRAVLRFLNLTTAERGGAAIVATLLACLLIVFTLSPVSARQSMPPTPGMENETPEQLQGVGIDEHLGSRIDLDLPFKNEKGEVVPLRSYFTDGKPVLLSLAYFSCPSLCNFHLNGLNDAFKKMKQTVGSEFNFLVVSIEPKENPKLAAEKKANYIKNYGRPEGAAGWHFLTTADGTDQAVQKLAKEVGFKYHWDEKQKQWAHSSVAYVLTPDGRISRYLYGIVFEPQTVRLSLLEAAGGKIGNVIDKLILFCFHFDPKASKYTLAAFNVMRAGGLLTVAIMAAFLAPFWLRARRNGNGNGDGNGQPPQDMNRLQGEA